MIRQDYIIRMIQEIFAAIANLILRRKHISKSDWEEYESTARQVLEVTPQQLEEMDGQTILEKYSQEKDGMEKTELAASWMTPSQPAITAANVNVEDSKAIWMPTG